METGLAVGEAMTKKPIRVPENLTIRECARLMREKKVGSVLVTDEEELLGIITNIDIIEKVVATGQDPDQTPVSDVMTTQVVTISPEKDIYDALRLMQDYDVRHMPVLHRGKLEGFLTMKDVLKIEPQLFEIVLDKIELREEERKLAYRYEDGYRDGFCEVCGNYSERLSRGADQRLVCPDCAQE